jgi:small conductance mechanosensitive channel
MLARRPLPLFALVSLVGLTLARIASGQAGQAVAKVAGVPATTRPTIRPLLPDQGLFDASTWVGLGRHLLTQIVENLPTLAAAVLVLIFFLLLSRLATRLLTRMLHRPHVDPALFDVIVPLARYLIVGIGVIMALAQANFQVGSLLAGFGIAGLALGLAAQDTLGNLVAGFTLLWDRPFRLGDRVTVADTYGEVVQIGLRSTRLRTNDKLLVILPNRDVVSKMIVNHTLTPSLRIAAPFLVDYRENVARVREVVLAAVSGHPGLREDLPVEVVVKELGAAGMQLELRGWLVDSQKERSTRWSLLEIVKTALDGAKIQTPQAQSFVRLDRESPPLRVSVEGDLFRSADDDAPGEH